MPLGKLFMRITQKIHGSNAQVHVYEQEGELKLCAGSRNRWICPDDDNFGFARFVYDHVQEFLDLGIGTHYGEWAGPGINSGEGLKERTFFLFSHPDRYSDKILPPNVEFVPELYKGPVDQSKINEVMDILLDHGSYAVPGFMKVEGIVVEIDGKRYKKTFTAEETKWCGIKKPKREPREFADYSYLLQPMRLEKLLSRDERYIVGYPETLTVIVKDYIADLIKEEQITGSMEDIDRIKKDCSRSIFHFVRDFLNEEVCP